MSFHLGSNVITIAPEWLRAIGIFGAFLLAAFIVNSVWEKVVTRITSKTKTSLDDLVFSVLKTLVFWSLIFAGAYYAFQEVSAAQKNTIIWTMVSKIFTITWIVLAVVMALRIFNTFTQWRIQESAAGDIGQTRDTATRANFVRKLLNAVTIIFGGLYILSVAGIDISPIVAGGALSGIVIGIALQDTLSNIFAGFFLNFDRPIKIGDFIRIDNNQEGYVEDVGWRYSRIRLIGNNLLIIPNNKLSQSLITNYSLTGHTLSVIVNCTVGYDNDLQRVEEIATKVASDFQPGDEEKHPHLKPQVRFKEFGADSISMAIIFRSPEIGSQNRLQHQFMKLLHQAFREHGVKMPK